MEQYNNNLQEDSIRSSFSNHDEQNSEKSAKTKHIIKNVCLIIVAVMVALMIPLFITSGVNRFVADMTHQWYLNPTSRILITIFITIFTYGMTYLIIRFTVLKKSIVFNIISFILVFLWAIFIGVLNIPD